MLFVPALFLYYGALCGASVPTFEHQDQLTGEMLKCSKCPPGTYMSAYCTATTDTQCAPCRSGHFTELWNYLPKCLYCSNFCTYNQEVETECSATTNRVCRCKQGFYQADDFCIMHSECGPGHGVRTRGTPQKNTVCEKCPEGYFSSSSSAVDSCAKHEECASGQTVLLNGSVYHNTVCGTCESLTDGGYTLRTFLSAMFSAHRMRVAKMKKFITRFISGSEELRYTRDTLPRQRGPLLDRIIDWVAQAPKEQLRKLPEMLKASQLNNMADKLVKRLNEIEQQSLNCSLIE